MRNKAMRVIAIMLCISMIASINAFAVSDVYIDSVTFQGIYEQLEDQDALDVLDVHEYVYSTTNPVPVIVPYGSDDEYTNKYAPFGGMMEYQTLVGGRRVGIANTYLDFDDSYYYVLGQLEVNIGDIIIAICGYIPIVGPIASTIANTKTIVNSAAATSIKNAKGYAQFTTTQYSEGTASSVAGWTRYPYMYLYDLSAFNINTTTFPENNPFES